MALRRGHAIAVRRAPTRRAAPFLLALVSALLLTSCGFKLRGARDLPFATLYLSTGTQSALGAELARNIRAGTSTAVVADRSQAQAVLELISERRERDIVAVNAQGRAREYTLRLRLAFRLLDAQGRELIPLTELVTTRDIAFNEAQVLAKESEEMLLFRDMQSDLVQQILRRLAGARVDAAKG
ncbi:MAG: LPS assembly lipoprotein LptE [Sutterellaceae bacterium]|nr:LPS assembly lipoprotein LptE [Burkholderiaceae bacterium]MDW8429467.1 LPS assembly lipoprotein LptE [Sutterellaceae bacterium]